MTVQEVTTTILQFVETHPNSAAAFVFVLAFGESLAFVSLFLPFFAILFGMGTIIAPFSLVYFFTIATSAAVGAALGDWLSYWIGFHYHERVRQMWPINKYPDLIDKGHVFFEKYGAWAVVLGRFTGPLRASVPIVAGITEMPWWRFQIANWSSAFLWAVVVLAPGYFGIKGLMHWLG